MIDRKILVEKMEQFGVDWISESGFLDGGRVEHILDLVEQESQLTQDAPDRLVGRTTQQKKNMEYTIDFLDKVARASTAQLAAEFEKCGYKNPTKFSNAMVRIVLEKAAQQGVQSDASPQEAQKDEPSGSRQ